MNNVRCWRCGREIELQSWPTETVLGQPSGEVIRWGPVGDGVFTCPESKNRYCGPPSQDGAA